MTALLNLSRHTPLVEAANLVQTVYNGKGHPECFLVLQVQSYEKKELDVTVHGVCFILF